MSQAARDAVPQVFSKAASEGLADEQLRANLELATSTIRVKRALVASGGGLGAFVGSLCHCDTFELLGFCDEHRALWALG